MKSNKERRKQKKRKPRRVEEKYPGLQKNICRAVQSGRYRVPSPGGDATGSVTKTKQNKETKQRNKTKLTQKKRKGNETERTDKAKQTGSPPPRQIYFS